MLKQNFHTHIYRCNHAEGDVADYCQQALRLGMTTLGISDHAPFPDDYTADWHFYAMKHQELPDYFHSIDKARQNFPQLTIYKAMECEPIPEIADYYQKELLDLYHADYLVMGAHCCFVDSKYYYASKIFTPELLRTHLDFTLAGMHSGLFDFVAHPDLIMINEKQWNADFEDYSRHILAAAEQLKMPLELNLYGLRKPPIFDGTIMRAPYPHKKFWELSRDYDIQVLINSDAHCLSHLIVDDEMANSWLGPDIRLNIINDSFVPKRVKPESVKLT